jgi:hypothetical protein
MQKRFLRLKASLRANWLTLGFLTIGLALLIIELTFRLSSLTYHHLSSSEVSNDLYAHSWHNLAANPLNAPLLILERLTHYVSNHSVFWLRLPSVFAAILGAALFYYIIRRWFNRFTAVITTILLTTSAYYLHISRLATSDILYFIAPLAMCAFVTHAARKESPVRLPLWAVVGLLTIGLYIPAFIWLLIIVLIIQPKLIRRPWQQSTAIGRGIALLPLIMLTPLVRALVLHHGLVRAWLGVGPLGQPSAILSRFLNVPYNLFVHGPPQPALWVGKMPIIPFAVSALCLLGAYELVDKRRRQALLVFSLGLVSWLICGIGGIAPLSLLIGPLYILAAAGLRYLSDEWFQVFPRNPFARSVGYAVLSLFCLSLVAYGWHAYFVAWPHNAATHQTFTYITTADNRLLLQ